MIPKKIHYCWFGGNPLPELAIKCIESWRKYCPDYEIIEWNESNFDVASCDYVREAYEAKKWAFVSDYARFKILYENGGLYFDTDVELIKPIDDIISKGGFMGMEDSSCNVAPGLGLAIVSQTDLYNELLESYHSRHFLNEDGTFNLKTIVDYTTEILLRHGLQREEKIQFIAGVYIYPREYFCPMNYITGELKTTKNTRSIHHYTASWYDESQKYAYKLKKRFSKVLPRRLSDVMATAIAKVKFEGFGACMKWIFKKRR